MIRRPVHAGPASRTIPLNGTPRAATSGAMSPPSLCPRSARRVLSMPPAWRSQRGDEPTFTVPEERQARAVDAARVAEPAERVLDVVSEVDARAPRDDAARLAGAAIVEPQHRD